MPRRRTQTTDESDARPGGQEEELSASEFRFRTVFETAAEGILVADAATRKIVSANPAICRMLGFSVEELGAMGVEDIHPKQSLESAIVAFDSLAQGQRSVAAAIPCQRKDGSILYADISSKPALVDGQACVIGFFTDVTGLVRAEAALRMNEERYRELFDHMGTCVAVYEARSDGNDFAVVDFNKAAERAEAIAREDVMGKSVLTVFPGVKQFGLFDVFMRVWRTGTPERHPVAEYRDQRISGWRDNYVYRLPSGEVVALYEDVTKQRQAEDALQKSEALYRALVETSPNAVALADQDGTITLMSEPLAALHGYEGAHELIGKNALELFAPEERQRAADNLRRGLQAAPGAVESFEYLLQRRDGTRFWGELRGTLMLPPTVESPSLLTVVRDITARRKWEEARRESAQRLHALAGRLANTQEAERRRISRELHDQVGQTLTALGMKLDRLSDELQAEGSAGTATLEDASALLSQSIQSIRTVMANLRPSILDDYGLSAALNSWETWFRRPESLVVAVDAQALIPRLPPDAETALFRITQEALTNVVKHAKAAYVAVRLGERDGVVRLEVEDDGVGFNTEEVGAKGSHWGQDIMRERADSVGASMTVRSSPGRGTHVIVEVPRR